MVDKYKMVKTWIRRDRETGKETELTFEEAWFKLSGSYSSLAETMRSASKDNCLTTGFADYYPKDGK